jgi:DNA helicase HerA-like ATPase
LNATQEGVLALVFKIADDSGLLLLDLKNLRAMLQFVGDNSRQFTTQSCNVSAASIGAIQRGLLEIEQQGGNQFFGDRCSTSMTCCRPTARGAGWSTSCPPKS